MTVRSFLGMTLGFMAIIGCFGVSASEAAPIAGKDPLAPVREVRSSTELRTGLEALLPAAKGRLMILSPSAWLSDPCLPLYRIGALSEVVAVLPGVKPLDGKSLDELRERLGQLGVSIPDRGGFALDNGLIRGRIEGMSLTVCSLPTIPSGGNPFVLAVDTAFFPEIYSNEATLPMIDVVGKVVVTLRARGIGAASAIIVDALPQPDFPLEHGDLALLLREMLSNPALFAEKLPDKWLLRRDADLTYFFSQHEEGRKLYGLWSTLEPRDGSAHFRIAMMSARDLDVVGALKGLADAVNVDRNYGRGYLAVAGYFAGKEIYDAAERVLAAGLLRLPGDAALSTGMAEFLVTRGDALSDAGQKEEADAFYRRAAGIDRASESIRALARSRRGMLR